MLIVKSVNLGDVAQPPSGSAPDRQSPLPCSSKPAAGRPAVPPHLFPASGGKARKNKPQRIGPKLECDDDETQLVPAPAITTANSQVVFECEEKIRIRAGHLPHAGNNMQCHPYPWARPLQRTPCQGLPSHKAHLPMRTSREHGLCVSEGCMFGSVRATRRIFGPEGRCRSMIITCPNFHKRSATSHESPPIHSH